MSTPLPPQLRLADVLSCSGYSKHCHFVRYAVDHVLTHRSSGGMFLNGLRLISVLSQLQVVCNSAMLVKSLMTDLLLLLTTM